MKSFQKLCFYQSARPNVVFRPRLRLLGDVLATLLQFVCGCVREEVKNVGPNFCAHVFLACVFLLSALFISSWCFMWAWPSKSKCLSPLMWALLVADLAYLMCWNHVVQSSDVFTCVQVLLMSLIFCPFHCGGFGHHHGGNWRFDVSTISWIRAGWHTATGGAPVGICAWAPSKRKTLLKMASLSAPFKIGGIGTV